MKLLYFLLTGCLSIVALAQEDSLYSRLKKADTDKSKIEILNQLGERAFNAGEYAISLTHYFDALKIKEQMANQKGLAKQYLKVGRVQYFLRDIEMSNKLSHEYLMKSYRLALEEKDTTSLIWAARGIGVVLGEWSRFDSSNYYLNRALHLSAQINDFGQMSSLNIIIGANYKFMGDTARCEEFMEKAILQAEVSKQDEPLAYALLSMAYLKSQEKKYSEARPLIERSLALYKKINLADGINNASGLYMQILSHTGTTREMYDLYANSWSIVHKLFAKRTADQFAELQTKYETEKKEQQLNILKIESELKEVELRQSRLLIGAVVGFFILIILSFWMVSQKKFYQLKSAMTEEKSRLQMIRFSAMLQAEEKERKRIARELHDGLGQLLSTARITISGMNESDRKVVNSISLIDQAVTEVRQISHNLMPHALTSIGWLEAVKDMVRKINESGEMDILFNHPKQVDFTEIQSIATYRILQELVNNALKYASASKLEILIQKEANHYILDIRDDGVGFDLGIVNDSEGIGWKTIQSRVDMLGGEIDVQSEIGKGTCVNIIVPILHETENS